MTFSSADFYRAFEDRFRGPRATIKERLKVYLSFIQPLQEKCGPLTAVDLGCGRGEWLELLTEHGIDAQGVDIDEGMLSDCRRLGLKVHTADALAFLQGLPDQSQALISGFHIAEHLPFDILQALVSQALRVLQPGGLLILETPNPENIAVGTASFYLDPTHQKPLPPPLLAFLTEFAGFRRQKVLRLQESPDVDRDGGQITLLQVLAGVSPDYAVVAQKDGPASLIAALGAPFAVEHGMTLDGLARQYQQQTEALARHTAIQAQLVEAQKLQLEAREQILEALAQQAEAKAQQAEAKAQQAEAKAQQAEAKAQHAEATNVKAQEDLQRLQAELAQATELARQAQSHVEALLTSTSWRITVPLRAVKNIWMRYRGFISRQRNGHGYFREPIINNKLSDYIVGASLSWSINYLQRRKWLKRVVLSVIRFFPGIERRLLARRAELRRKSYAMTFGAGNFSTPMAVFDSHLGLLDIGSPERRSPEEIIVKIKSELSTLQAGTHEGATHG